MIRTWAKSFAADPRHYQIAVLACLLCYGMMALHLDISPGRVALTLAGVLTCQLACTRIFRLPAFDWRSACISGLSLCLLLRTGSAAIALAAAFLAIAPKFLVRVAGRHVFNPTNLALVGVMLLTRNAWVSPGQWGNPTWFALAIACLGGLVIQRAARADVSLTFLAFYAALLVWSSAWLGEPMTIPAHRLESGALLIFTFFMISDPRTTPASRAGRILFALLVAWLAWYWQFRLFRTSGPVWALALLSPVVPILNRLLPGPAHEWASASGSNKGDIHEVHSNPRRAALPAS